MSKDLSQWRIEKAEMPFKDGEQLENLTSVKVRAAIVHFNTVFWLEEIMTKLSL